MKSFANIAVRRLWKQPHSVSHTLTMDIYIYIYPIYIAYIYAIHLKACDERDESESFHIQRSNVLGFFNTPG